MVREIRNSFDRPADADLVLRVYGDEADDAFREALASAGGDRAAAMVRAPSAAAFERTLSVLSRDEHQRRIVAQALSIFGRRLIDPLGEQLEPRLAGSLFARLGLMRDMVLAHVADLKLSPSSRELLAHELRKLLSDELFSRIGEHEERVHRPRVTRLAQDVLQVIAAIFRRALMHWPEHAAELARSLSRRLPDPMILGELPALLGEQMTTGIEELLWIETRTEVEGAIRELFTEHRSAVTVDPVRLEREAYREFAECCWQIIVEAC